MIEKMERETGIEPATNSLEGCDSTIELLPRASFVKYNRSILNYGIECWGLDGSAIVFASRDYGSRCILVGLLSLGWDALDSSFAGRGCDGPRMEDALGRGAGSAACRTGCRRGDGTVHSGSRGSLRIHRL